MAIVVFHPPIQGNGGQTTFEGPEVKYAIDEDGSLRILTWKTPTNYGEALFAPGFWQYVCHSKSLATH